MSLTFHKHVFCEPCVYERRQYLLLLHNSRVLRLSLDLRIFLVECDVPCSDDGAGDELGRSFSLALPRFLRELWEAEEVRGRKKESDSLTQAIQLNTELAAFQGQLCVSALCRTKNGCHLKWTIMESMMIQ